MLYVKLKNLIPQPLQKPIFTIGLGTGFDLELPSRNSPEIIATVKRKSENEYSIYPGNKKIYLNNKILKYSQSLEDGDVVHIDTTPLIFLKESLLKTDLSERNNEADPFQILKVLSSDFGTSAPLSQNLKLALLSLIDYANAEYGALLTADPNTSEWSFLVEALGEQGTSHLGEVRQSLLSDTVLNQALKSSEPVYIESILGHPYESQASIVDARLFSMACIPLFVSGYELFGALYLTTRSPGKIIHKNRLATLKEVATFLTLVAQSTQQNGSKHQTTPPLPSYPTSLVWHPESLSPMASVMDRVSKMKDYDIPVLIRGETGTGKELIAKEIHAQSRRHDQPFVAVNCAAIPASLMESILFGSKKGAFTGAVRDTEGKFMQAHGGTLFLDEIGDLSFELQTKLLRAIQEKEIEPVGGEGPVKVDVRIISATHQPLEARMEEGKFRKDLYFRLNGATLKLPSLKERGPGEILLLANHFLRKHRSPCELSEDAKQKLVSHAWPGNVRELEQVIQRSIIFCNPPFIRAADLEMDTLTLSTPATFGSAVSAETLREAQDQFTSHFVSQVLEKCNGNKTKAAELLRISERTLYRLLAHDKNDSSYGHD